MLEALLCLAVVGFVFAETAITTLTLPEVVQLRIQNAYKDAMLASAEVQRVQAAVIAASPDCQTATKAFQKTVDDYNALLAKEAADAKLPKGATIVYDPTTKIASVKQPPSEPVKK